MSAEDNFKGTNGEPCRQHCPSCDNSGCEHNPEYGKEESKNKHTPGPWHLNKALLEVFATPNIHIASMPLKQSPSFKIDTTEDERFANAKLIAAAPEMLECLQKIADLQVDTVHLLKIGNTGINDVIKKATGEK